MYNSCIHAESNEARARGSLALLAAQGENVREGTLMTGVLSGMRVVEGSAFVAAPTCGMTLAQLGADVIRFDMIGGGIDYKRWPVTAEGNSIFISSLNFSVVTLLMNMSSRGLTAGSSYSDY